MNNEYSKTQLYRFDVCITYYIMFIIICIIVIFQTMYLEAEWVLFWFFSRNNFIRPAN